MGKRILLTGATGFVGCHLYPKLIDEGHDVVCATRNLNRAARHHPGRSWVELDLYRDDLVGPAVKDVQLVYYLVHSMAEGPGYRERELEAARRILHAAERAGVERLVYLGGVAPSGPPSVHLGSRLETGRVLRSSSVPCIELRAGMIIGAGSALVNVAGLLHDGRLGPERRLEEVDPAQLARLFAVNAYGPLLVAKHFYRLMVHEERAVLANVSARVGSIGDNRLGGWYAYRASKAAQNMFTKNLAIEFKRRAKNLVVVALHPGTVDTDLSRPFRRSVPPSKLFSVDRAASQLLEIIDQVGPADSGNFIGWDGQRIPW